MISSFGIIAFGFILFGVSISQGQNVEANQNGLATTAQYSTLLADNYQNVNDFYHETYSDNEINKNVKSSLQYLDNVFAVGNNIMISDQEIQQYADYYKNEGLNENEALSAAIEDAEERNALYVEAIKNGYIVTDEEIYQWLDVLRETLEEDTTGVYQAALEGFDSEDAYWDFEYKVYTVDLPIQKYVSAKEKEFFMNNPEAMNADVPYNEWTKAFEELKNELVEKQNFQVVQ